MTKILSMVSHKNYDLHAKWIPSELLWIVDGVLTMNRRLYYTLTCFIRVESPIPDQDHVDNV